MKTKKLCRRNEQGSAIIYTLAKADRILGEENIGMINQ